MSRKFATRCAQRTAVELLLHATEKPQSTVHTPHEGPLPVVRHADCRMIETRWHQDDFGECQVLSVRRAVRRANQRNSIVAIS